MSGHCALLLTSDLTALRVRLATVADFWFWFWFRRDEIQLLSAPTSTPALP